MGENFSVNKCGLSTFLVKVCVLASYSVSTPSSLIASTLEDLLPKLLPEPPILPMPIGFVENVIRCGWDELKGLGTLLSICNMTNEHLQRIELLLVKS